jgi:hypothetical protein
MVSLDGTEYYYPQSADEARRFAADNGAVPANPGLWPWKSEVPVSDGADLENPAAPPAEDLGSADPKEQPSADGGPDSAPVTPGAAPEPAQAPATGDDEPVQGLVTSCPQPAACFPLGLPDNCSYATCVHGAWTIGD